MQVAQDCTGCHQQIILRKLNVITPTTLGTLPAWQDRIVKSHTLLLLVQGCLQATA